MKAHKKAVAGWVGWVGVAITVVLSSLWAYWGAIENFHEGWYSTSMWENLFMLLFQYLLFTLVFVTLAVVALRWRRIGLALHIATAGFSYWFFWGLVPCNTYTCQLPSSGSGVWLGQGEEDIWDIYSTRTRLHAA